MASTLTWKESTAQLESWVIPLGSILREDSWVIPLGSILVRTLSQALFLHTELKHPYGAELEHPTLLTVSIQPSAALHEPRVPAVLIPLAPPPIELSP